MPRTVSEVPRPPKETTTCDESPVAAVVSIRRDEGSLPVWHEAAMRFELVVAGAGALR